MGKKYTVGAVDFPNMFNVDMGAPLDNRDVVDRYADLETAIGVNRYEGELVYVTTDSTVDNVTYPSGYYYYKNETDGWVQFKGSGGGSEYISLGQASNSWSVRVIGLIRYTGTSSSLSGEMSVGRIMFVRGNAVQGYTFTFDYNVCDDYSYANPRMEYVANILSTNVLSATDSGHSNGFKPCTFEYDGDKWLGVMFYCDQRDDLFWNGKATNTPFAIQICHYGNAQYTGFTIDNQSVYDSVNFGNISLIPDKRFFNGRALTTSTDSITTKVKGYESGASGYLAYYGDNNTVRAAGAVGGGSVDTLKLGNQNLMFNSGGDGIYVNGSSIGYHNTNNSWVKTPVYFKKMDENYNNVYVGINNSAPSYQLDVSGDIRSSNTLRGANVLVSKSGEAYIRCENANLHNSGSSTNLQVQLFVTTGGYHGVYSTGYWDGSAYTNDPKWVVYRRQDGNVVLNGNAATATTWETARTLTIGATGKSVNGSANVSWTPTEINRVSLGTTSDYNRCVVALCLLSGATVEINSNWHGKVFVVRTNGLVFSQWADVDVSADYATANAFRYTLTTSNRNTSTTARSGSGYRPCVFKYENKYYGGLEFYQMQMVTVYVNGVGTFTPFKVDYYKTNNTTVLNSEINDSLVYSGSQIIHNGLSYNGSLIGNADTATTATKLGTANVGNSKTPFYLNAGVPTKCDIYRYHYSDSSTWNNAPWHKVAYKVVSSASADYVLTLLVSRGDNTTIGNGILRCRVRRDANDNGGNPVLNTTQTAISWIINNGIDVDDFVLVWDSTNVTIELWCKIPARYGGYHFTVLDSGSRWENNELTWTLCGSLNGIGSATYTSGTVFKSKNNPIDMPLGGRNLVRNSADMSLRDTSAGIVGWRLSESGTLTHQDINNAPISLLKGAIRLTNSGSSSIRSGAAQDNLYVSLKNGDYITESFYIRASVEFTSAIQIQPFYKSASTIASISITKTITTDWQYIKATARVNADYTGTASLGYVHVNSLPAGAWYEVCGMKVEWGGTATDWTPAIEDYADVAFSGDYDDLSNKPTSLPASDVSAWAKAADKPSYTLDEVSDGSTRKLADFLPLSGGTMTGTLTLSKIRINGKAASANKNNGIYYYDGTNDYLLIGQGSSNLWIGANETAGTHHIGSTYISSGDGETYISRLVNNTRTNYKVLDTGNTYVSSNKGYINGTEITTISGNAATATTATKLGTSTVGGTTTPIYLNNGVPTALNYTIAKSVPSDAKFTDTTYTFQDGLSASGTTVSNSGVRSVTESATNGSISVNTGGTSTDVAVHGLSDLAYIAKGTSGFLKHDGTWATPTDTKNTAGSTDTSSKIFIVGATSQAANPQTYSHDTAYVGTDGHLYSNSKQVVNLSDTQALTNKTYEGYTLGAACAKGVETSLTNTNNNVPTSAAVKSFVENKGYITTVPAAAKTTLGGIKIWVESGTSDILRISTT